MRRLKCRRESAIKERNKKKTRKNKMYTNRGVKRTACLNVIITIFSPKCNSSVRRFINVNTMGITRELNVQFYEWKTRNGYLIFLRSQLHDTAVHSIWRAGFAQNVDDFSAVTLSILIYFRQRKNSRTVDTLDTLAFPHFNVYYLCISFFFHQIYNVRR